MYESAYQHMASICTMSEAITHPIGWPVSASVSVSASVPRYNKVAKMRSMTNMDFSWASGPLRKNVLQRAKRDSMIKNKISDDSKKRRWSDDEEH